MASIRGIPRIEAIRRLAPQTTLASTNPPVLAAQCTLELTPVALTLAGERAVKPDMLLTCEVQVRLVRVTDQAELFSGTFKYIGSARPLRQWAAAGGLEFRAALATACNELAEQIVERVFLYYPVPENPAQTRILPWTSGKQD